MPFQKGNKLGKFNKGRKFGPLSLDTKRKISEVKKRYPTKFWLGKKHPMSEETKKKISDARKKEWQNGKRNPEFLRKLGLSLKGKPNLKNRKEFYKTDESKIWRKRIEYRLWREAVFARDNWICQKCKQRGGKLHPHHIRSFSLFSELRFAIDNGITLCVNCHRFLHKIYGKKIKDTSYVERFF